MSGFYGCCPTEEWQNACNHWAAAGLTTRGEVPGGPGREMITLELGPSAGGGATGSLPISVYLVDDVAELRELVRLGLEEDPDFEVAGEAGDGRSGIEGI